MKHRQAFLHLIKHTETESFVVVPHIITATFSTKFTFDNRSRDMVSVYSTSDPSVEENGQRREAIEFQ